MAIPLNVNGVTFAFPQVFDRNWGTAVTNWAEAVTNGMLQKAGGTFTLTDDVDFGANFGLQSIYLLSRSADPIAEDGVLRMARTDVIAFRNEEDDDDLLLGVNASNQITFNGSPIAATQSLDNGKIFIGDVTNTPTPQTISGDITMTSSGVTTIANDSITLAKLASNAVTNVKIDAAAAITRSKLAVGTANRLVYNANATGIMTDLTAMTAARVLISDANGLPVHSSTTTTVLGYLDVSSSIQTQLNARLSLTGGTMSGAIAMGNNKITGLDQGTATGNAIAYPVNTAQISANAITQATGVFSASNAGFTGTNLTSKTITTTGGPVLIFASAAFYTNDSTGIVGFKGTVMRDNSTQVAGGFAAFGQAASPYSISAVMPMLGIDTPAAGTYTYYLNYTKNAGGAIIATDYALNVVELKR